MIKCVLFDMDGVLIDAKDWHYEALNRVLELFGLAIERDAHLATFDGLPTRKKLEILTKSRGLPIGLHNFINELKQMYTAEIAYRRCKPNFQHRLTLARLKERGLKMGVCSNSVRRSVQLMMSLSQLEPYIDLQLSNEDVTRSKPDPEIYLLAMSRFSVAPTETLIVEDNEHGIRAATDSGAHLLAVNSPDDVSYDRVSEKIRILDASL